MHQTAAILAVGSELLSGQILNRNAAWLSGRLFALGIETRAHLTLDDVESDLIAGIEALTARSDLLLTTGGLGPTSDDLTREAIARWAGEELIFDAGSWEHIRTRFARFSNTVPETNRRQCYFPRSATILTNRAGTANGFMLRARGKELWVLPGPPHEVETLWDDFVRAALVDRVPPAARKRLRMWRTIGKGESHLAEMIVPLVGHEAGLEVAYRAHAPYVELKLRFPETEAERFAPLCEDVTAALRPWLYEMDQEDLVAKLVEQLTPLGSVDVYDGVTQGHLAELVTPQLRGALKGTGPISLATSFDAHDDPAIFIEQTLALDHDAGVLLAVAGVDANGTWAVGMRRGEERRVEEHPSPYLGDAMRARNLKAIAALAVKAWVEMLAEGLH